MAKPAVKLGWALFGVWLLSVTLIWQSYRLVESTKQQVYELSRGAEELRNTFNFETPFHNQVLDSQSLNLQLIYALRLQISTTYPNSWLMPDISQLLYTTDRFIDQSQAYIDNELSLLDLVDRIQQSRRQYQTDLASPIYSQLSAAVFEAMFGSNGSDPRIYRTLDSLYLLADDLPQNQGDDLKSLLVNVSSVLGSYAQGRHTVDKLLGHDIHTQIEVQRNYFNQTLEQHIWLAAVLTLLLILGFLLLLMKASSVKVVEDEPQVIPHNDPVDLPSQPAVLSESKPVVAPKNPKTEPEINISSMLDSLNGDKESVCLLLEVFIEDHAQDIEKITQLLANAPEEAQRKAHSLKGVGGSLGATNLRSAATEVELAIQQDMTQVPKLLGQLESRLDQAISDAKEYLSHSQHQKNVS